MGFYSFIVMAPDEIPIPEHVIYLDAGRNVFNVMLEDIDAFKQRLTDAGVEILQVNRLDEYEQVEPLDIELEEEVSFDDPTLPGPR